MKRLIIAAATLGLYAVSTPISAAPYCDALLLSQDSLPKKFMKRGPFYSDDVSGWIFGADQLKSDFHVTPEALSLLSLIADEFKAAGTQLVVLAPPPRPALAPPNVRKAAKLPAEYQAEGSLAAFSDYIDQLNLAGIVAPDLSDVATASDLQDFYFKRDTHWSPRGAFLSAHALATSLGMPPADPPEFSEKYVEKGSLSMVVDAACGHRPEAETAARSDFAQTGSLFGDTNKPKVALVGTSFSDRYKRDAYQVADAVAYALDADVANVSLTGGGLTGAMTAFLAQEGLDLSTFETVIWESPYTAPLTDVGGLRHVLGLLRNRSATTANQIFMGKIDGNWTGISQALVVDAQTMLEIRVPGVETGVLSIELIDIQGEKQRYKLQKSNRIPPESRDDRWILALDGLEKTHPQRVKLKLKSKDTGQRAQVQILR